MKASQTWRINAGDETRIMDGQNNPICDVKCGGMSGRTVAEGEAIAARIVRAVNNHDAMVAALDRIAEIAGPGQEMDLSAAIDALCDAYNIAVNAREKIGAA